LGTEAARFLKRKEGGAQAEPLRKRHRLKSYELLVAADNAMKVGTARGWADYAVRPGDGVAPSLWPLRLVVMDRGSDGVAGINFLQRELRCNVDVFFGVSHDCWNDYKNTLKRANMWIHMLTMVLAFNSGHGASDDKLRFQQVRDVTQTLFAELVADDDEASIVASRPPASSHLQGADADELAAALENSIAPARRMAFLFGRALRL
jgi:hypothetical protein